MAPSPKDEEPGFRFIVKIMPPRRPTNSLFSRLHAPQPNEPLYTIAVPARSSETFADVWKHIKERYERNYTAEEVAKGWFHKLQDRFGADIDSSDGVGELGYTPKSPSEDLVLVMLQNAIDRDGSVPDTSGLRPSGFSRPLLNSEQEQEAKRRKLQEERYGAALEDFTEDTPIESRERSLDPGSPELGGQSDVNQTGDSGRRIDADGFAVPTLPGSVTRKRKRSSKSHTDGAVIQSSMESEDDEDILAQNSQNASANGQNNNNGSLAQDLQTPRSRIMQSVPAEATAKPSASVTGVGRAQTTAPMARADQNDKLSLNAKPISASSSKTKAGADRPGPPPTPKPAVRQNVTQQPPESAQRPRSTPCTPGLHNVQRQPAAKDRSTQGDIDLDPIEDDDLLMGINGTADDDLHETPTANRLQVEPSDRGSELASSQFKPGKLPRPNKKLALTPGAKASHSKQLALTPGSLAMERLSDTQDSAGKNPRSQSFAKNAWTSEEDSYILRGLHKGLNAAEILKKYDLPGRTASAVRGRRILLRNKHGIVEGNRPGEGNDNDGDNESVQSVKKKPNRPWTTEEVRKLTRGIADGYDALEILVLHFPDRSEDAVIRKVLALQNQVWKNAAKEPMFPQNDAELDGWTLKDSCKMWRTYRENLTTRDAAKRFFGRWSLPDVEKQLGAYKAKLKKIENDQANARQTGEALRNSVVDSSQLLAESSQMLPQSSPAERTMQARAARRSSIEPTRTAAIQVPSSPPQNNEVEPTSLEAKEGVQLSVQAQRSSPTVHIPLLEQNSARRNILQPSTKSSRQSMLSFSRDKGKQRAGPPRPSTEELDAQYSRRQIPNGDGSSTQPQQAQTETASHEETGLPSIDEDDDDDDDDDEHTPADDLDMLDAELRNETVEPHAKTEPSSDAQTAGLQSNGPSATSANAQVPQPSDERSGANSKDLILQSPMTTRDGTASTSSGRRRSRVESGVDTRAAAQLSQELNRSLSREEREKLEEAAHENQVFETPNTKITKYHKAVAKPGVAAVANKLVSPDDATIEPETQAFQTQDPTTSRSQRALHSTLQSKQGARGHGLYFANAQRTPTLQPSPHIGSSESGDTPTITPATTPAQSGRLPARGESYASRIRELHNPSQPAAGAVSKTTKKPTAESSASKSDDNGRSPTPTDSSIWEKTACAEKIGRDRQEYFEDLKISTFSIRAMGRGDWDEVRRLKAEEKRLHRKRKIARGDRVPSERDAEHRDGPAQGGDTDQADEDVIRVDDNSDMSSDEDEEDDSDGKIWSDDGIEQPQEMDRDRHFSEVEDDEEENVDQAKDAGQRAVEEKNHHEGEGQDVYATKEDEDMVDAAGKSQGVLQANGIDASGAHEEDEDELELPTVATLPEVTGDTTHALTDDNLQELNNSGAEESPTRLSRKRKASEERSSPRAKRNKQHSDSKVEFPPPPKMDDQGGHGKSSSKRQKRRKRHSLQNSGEGCSKRSSSFSNHPGSEAAQQHVPSTPVQFGRAADPSNSAEFSKATPAQQIPKWKTQTPTKPQQPTAAASRKLPVSSAARTQRSNGGGMSGLAGLVRKAHIPTPPKVKRTPQKENEKSRPKLDPNADDEDSVESSDGD